MSLNLTDFMNALKEDFQRIPFEPVTEMEYSPNETSIKNRYFTILKQEIPQAYSKPPFHNVDTAFITLAKTIERFVATIPKINKDLITTIKTNLSKKLALTIIRIGKRKEIDKPNYTLQLPPENASQLKDKSIYKEVDKAIKAFQDNEQQLTAILISTQEPFIEKLCKTSDEKLKQLESQIKAIEAAPKLEDQLGKIEKIEEQFQPIQQHLQFTSKEDQILQNLVQKTSVKLEEQNKLSEQFNLSDLKKLSQLYLDFHNIKIKCTIDTDDRAFFSRKSRK